MEIKEIKKEIPHNIVLDNRVKITMTGVLEVFSASIKEVVGKCSCGNFKLIGQDLKVNKLSLEEKLLIVQGQIDELKYLNATLDKKNFFKKLFK